MERSSIESAFANDPPRTARALAKVGVDTGSDGLSFTVAPYRMSTNPAAAHSAPVWVALIFGDATTQSKGKTSCLVNLEDCAKTC